MRVVFNELSIDERYRNCMSTVHPRDQINQFVELLHILFSSSKIQSLVTLPDIYSFRLTKDYGVKDWFEEKEPLVKRSHKQFLKSVYNRCSFLERESYGDRELCIEIDGMDIAALGCLVAYEMEEYAISVFTNEIWKAIIISGKYRILDETYGMNEEDVEMKNISSVEHISAFEKQERESLYENISSGQDLWEKREILFPNLWFCEKVKEQLYQDHEQYHIEQIMKKLMRLDEYFSNYDGRYDPEELGLNARTESQTVKQTSKLYLQRLFKIPDGREEYFFDHIGFWGKYCGRIYFLPDRISGKGIIGYIGKHLKTAQYK